MWDDDVITSEAELDLDRESSIDSRSDGQAPPGASARRGRDPYAVVRVIAWALLGAVVTRRAAGATEAALVGGIAGAVLSIVAVAPLRWGLALTNRDVAEAQGDPSLRRTVGRAFVTLVPFAVLAVAADLWLAWDAGLVFATAGLMTASSASAAEVARAGGRLLPSMVIATVWGLAISVALSAGAVKMAPTAVATVAAQAAAPLPTGEGNSGELGRRESGYYVKWSVTGMRLNARSGRDVTGVLTSRRVVLSGTAYVGLGPGGVTRPGLSVVLAGADPLREVRYTWPPANLLDQNGVMGGPFQQEHNFTYAYEVEPGDYKVSFNIAASLTGGITEGVSINGYAVRDPTIPLSEPPDTVSSGADPEARVPGLGGAGPLPGPATLPQGLIGTLLPGLLGILGALLSGLVGGPTGQPVPPVRRPRAPAGRKRERQPGADVPSTPKGEPPTPPSPPTPPPRRRRTGAPTSDGEGVEAAGGTPPGEPTDPVEREKRGLPAHPERAGRVAAAKTAAAIAQDRARAANAPGHVFTDAMGRFGGEVIDSIGTIGGALGAAYGALKSAGRAVVNDPAVIGRVAGQAAAAVGRGVDAFKAAAAQAGTDLRQAGKDVWASPGLIWDTATGTLGTIWRTITDPAKVGGALKVVTGLQNFENAIDSKRSLLSRLGQVAVGTLSAYGSLSMAQAAGAAARRGASGVLGRLRGSAQRAVAGGTDDAATAAAARRTATNRASAAATKPAGTTPAARSARAPVADPYIPADGPPGLRGLTRDAVREAQAAADGGARIAVRPTNPYAKGLIESGVGKPKEAWCKLKAIGPDDLKLGARPDSLAKVGYFRPRWPPGESITKNPRLWKAYNARRAEFAQQAKEIGRRVRSGQIKVKNGVVTDAKTGKAFVSDNDLWEIAAADGTKHAGVFNRTYSRLERGAFRAQHPDVVSWDLSKYDRKPRYSGLPDMDELVGGVPVSDFDEATAVARAVTSKHTYGVPGAEPLVIFRPGKPPIAAWLKPK